MIQARTYRSAQQDGRLASIGPSLEHHQGLPGKARPVVGRSEGDCTPVTVTPKDTTVYFWGLVADVVQEEKLQAARWHN